MAARPRTGCFLSFSARWPAAAVAGRPRTVFLSPFSVCDGVRRRRRRGPSPASSSPFPCPIACGWGGGEAPHRFFPFFVARARGAAAAARHRDGVLSSFSAKLARAFEGGRWWPRCTIRVTNRSCLECWNLKPVVSYRLGKLSGWKKNLISCRYKSPSHPVFFFKKKNRQATVIF